MNSNSTRATSSSSDTASIIAQLQQTNPQILALLQANRPDLFEPSNEHLLSAALSVVAASVSNAAAHGHSHVHSPSCGHSHMPMHFSQPVPEPQKPDVANMNIVEAVQYNEIERLKQLIESGQADVNAPDSQGCYLMHWAAINNHTEIMRYLIAKGAKADIKGGDLKSTPLHWACRQGCTEAFFLLVDNEASINSVDINGVQPIHIASQYGQIKILAYLLGSGIDVECRDQREFTPLLYACIGPPSDYQGPYQCCTQFLLTFGADVNYQEPIRSFSPLHFAINNRNPTSFHVLLKHPQINIHLKNNENTDPLLFARLRSNGHAVEMLDNYIKSHKMNVTPKFMQRWFASEYRRQWLTRLFMLFVLVFIGLAANAYEYPYWARIVVPVVVLFLAGHFFNYFIFDAYVLNNLAFSYVLSSALLMYTTYWIYLQETKLTVLDVIYHFSTFYGPYCIYCIKKVNPGFLKHQNMLIDGTNLTREKTCISFARDPRWTLDHFCVTCLIRRPLRSKHCPADGSCVMKFDHHCNWLNACIGGRNYFYFIRVLTFGVFALWIWMYKFIRILLADAENYTFINLILIVHDPWLLYMGIITTFNTVWVTLMTGFHYINAICFGVTVNERLTGFRYSYFHDPNTNNFVNPFKRQKFRNFLETLGLFRLMSFFGYNRIDWSQIYDISQIYDTKNN